MERRVIIAPASIILTGLTSGLFSSLIFTSGFEIPDEPDV